MEGLDGNSGREMEVRVSGRGEDVGAFGATSTWEEGGATASISVEVFSIILTVVDRMVVMDWMGEELAKVGVDAGKVVEEVMGMDTEVGCDGGGGAGAGVGILEVSEVGWLVLERTEVEET